MNCVVIKPTEQNAWNFWNSYYIAETILEICTLVFTQIKEIGQAYKRFSQYSIKKLEHVIHFFSQLNGVLYCFNFLASIHLILEGRFFNRYQLLQTVSNICAFVSELLTPIYWLHEKGLLFLGKCASAIGKSIEIFDGLSYCLGFISDCITVFKEEWGERKFRAILDIVWFFLWVIGKSLEYTTQPTTATTAIINGIYCARLSIVLYEELDLIIE